MWSSYSPKEAAQLIGLPEAVVRGLARAGVIGDGAVPPRLGFRDLAALRAVAAVIAAGVPAARAQREVIALVARQPGLKLPDLSIEASDGHVRIKGEPASAVLPQLSLPLAPAKEREEGAVHAMPVRPELPAPTPVAAFTADEWFERALELEDSNVEAAIDAYKRSLKLRPDSTEAWVNLGRLHAESGDAAAAAECFASALELDPNDATSLYNLGVVAQDGGREQEAVGLYTRALELDPELAEAHYNLATIFDQSGDPQLAIRHINEYRKLTR